MSLIIELNGNKPKYGENCFFAQNSTIIGDVTMGDNCSVWFNAVIRGDVNSIIIGNNVNIQDGVIVHGTYQKFSTDLEDNVSIGHNAVIHGCKIQQNVLVGMGAIILDNVIIEENCVVAAGSVVTKGTILKSGYIYAGTPAKMIKPLSQEMIDGEIKRIAEAYKMYASWYKK